MALESPANVTRRRRSWRGAVGAVTVLCLLVLGGGGALAADLQRFRQANAGRVLPGAVIADVDVGGLNQAEAIAAVEAALAPVLDRTLSITAGSRRWQTTLRELGATTNAASVVDRALATTNAVRWTTLAALRWRAQPVPYQAQVAVSQPAEAAGRLVDEIAEVLDTPARDAKVGYNRTRWWIVPEAEGTRVQREETTNRILEALAGQSDVVEVALEPVQPKVTSKDFRQVLFLRQAAHQLDLYLDGRLTRSYLVATGTGGYPTPTGVYQVSAKRRNPVWVNPAPAGWGRNLPARIGPGRKNPLGLRALNWSRVRAIRFHGTANVDSLGRDASRGCVRLSNPDIVELFDLVDVGATIISTR